MKKKLISDYNTAKANGETNIIIPRILYPTVGKNEPMSCMEDPRVILYLDKVAPLTYDYYEIYNFNTYLQS